DRDHDGVPSIAAGGNDCDDGNPAVHGNFFALKDQPLTVGGQPVLWSPGEAALGDSGELLLNRGGNVDKLRSATPEPTLTPVASGANPGSIAADRDYVAFGIGNQVIIKRDTGTGWIDAGTIDADAPVGALAYSSPFLGVDYAVFQ